MFLFRDRNYSTIQLPNSEFIVPYKELMNHKLFDDFDETEHLISPFWRLERFLNFCYKIMLFWKEFNESNE